MSTSDVFFSEFNVTEKSMRPNSVDKRCFYCGQIVGAKHLNTCVLIQKRVKLRFTVEYETDRPAFWDKETTEFFYNESSSCMNNVIGEISAYAEENDYPCMCGLGKIEFIGSDEKSFIDEG